MTTQAATLAKVRIRLDELVEARWTDTELREYINEGVRDVARRSETIQKLATVAATAGTRKYSLPNDTLRVHKVEYQRTGDTRIYPLELMDLHAMDAMWYTQQAVTTSTPIAVTFWGYPPALDMISYPTPAENGQYIVHYYGLPDNLATATLTDANTALQIPGGWEDCVNEYVLYMAWRKDANPRWQEAKAAYEEHVDDMITRTQRWTDGGGVITPNTGRTLPDWLIGGY